MHTADYVRKAIDDWGRGELEPALLQTLAAVDGTAVKSYPQIKGSRDRFVRLIDDHLWLVEPMLAIGINLETTTFSWIRLKKRNSKFSEVIYEVFRCNLAHGSPIPQGSGLTVRFSHMARRAKFGPDLIELPDTAIFALLAVVVFARTNAGQRIGSDYFPDACRTAVRHRHVVGSRRRRSPLLRPGAWAVAAGHDELLSDWQRQPGTAGVPRCRRPSPLGTKRSLLLCTERTANLCPMAR